MSKKLGTLFEERQWVLSYMKEIVRKETYEKQHMGQELNLKEIKRISTAEKESKLLKMI